MLKHVLPFKITAALVLVLALSGRAAAQDATLTLAGDIPTPTTLTIAQMKAMPRAQVTVQEDGGPVVYEGVALTELLKRAGAPTGAELRGNNLASYLVAVARDGYQVVFSLAEVDPGLTRAVVIVADSIDGKPLFDYQGPFRIIVSNDSRPARSVRMLQRIDIVRLRK